jgi:ankyrin repeat protein
MVENNCWIDSNSDYSPLFYLCKSKNIKMEIIKYLVENKAILNYDEKIKIKYQECYYPIHGALENKNKNQSFHLIKYLVEMKTDLSQPNEKFFNPLNHALIYNYPISIIKYLIENNSSIDLCDDKDYNSLHYACQNSSLDIIEYLIEKKADINQINDEYLTPFQSLFIYSDLNNNEMIKFLEKYIGFDKNELNYYFLYYFSNEKKYLEIVKYFVEKKS